MNKIIPIILCGGSGKRLWPLSRTEYPKQFLALFGNYSLLQNTIQRLMGNDLFEKPIIICNNSHRFIVAQQANEIGLNDPVILVEPSSRNTAIAIAASIEFIKKTNSSAKIMVLPSDQIIDNFDAFYKAAKLAYLESDNGKIVCFGVKPVHASVEYGYIQVADINPNGSYKINRFVEKPTLKAALRFLSSDDFFWNSGIFMCSVTVFQKELFQYAPKLFEHANLAVNNLKNDLDIFLKLSEQAYLNAENISIDYALMEKTDELSLVTFDGVWRDLGSWGSVCDLSPTDRDGNVFVGDVVARDTANSYIHSNHKLITVLAVSDIVVIDTPDALFITNRSNPNGVTKILDQLHDKNRKEENAHRKKYRPWGWFDSIQSGEYFQVKRLHVNAHSKLSYQSHKKRTEHWTVVVGKATIIKNDIKYELKAGESIYIPVQAKHSLANETENDLEVIEVQSGAYLGEDDIIRYEDNYGRVGDLKNER